MPSTGTGNTVTSMELDFLQWILLVPVIVGSVYGFLCLLTMRRFQAHASERVEAPPGGWPAVTILKPICGLDKGLEENLRSACSQDYPEYQVVLSAQDENDPAVPVMQKIRKEFPDRVDLVIENTVVGLNGKVNNLTGALRHARHDVLVISDSDTRLGRDYLKRIIAPLADRNVGYVCTPYKATAAGRWYEKLCLLSFNADFVPGVIFAYVTGAAKFCLGSSVAVRREDLAGIGGLEGLSEYLAEDYEMGRRILNTGKRMVLVPYWVEILMDVKGAAQWWNYQVLWDQKTRAADPVGFFSTVVTRSVPFAVLLAAYRLADGIGIAILGLAVLLRLAGVAAILKWEIKDIEGLRALWLLPVRDVAALASWAVALTKRTVVWRNSCFTLGRDGRLARRES